MLIKIVSNLNDAELIDKLRYNICGMDYQKDNYFINKIKNKELCVLSCTLDNDLVGGLYLSNYMNSLYIEKVFVKDEYRGFNIASSMINYVIDNKQYFESFFGNQFDYSKLEPNSIDIIEMYKKIGYRGPDDLNIMKKRI